MVSSLIAGGARVEQVCLKKWTAMHEASRAGCVGVMELLLQHGGQVSEADQYGVTPLGIAAEYSHSEVLELLIKHGEPMMPHWFNLCFKIVFVLLLMILFVVYTLKRCRCKRPGAKWRQRPVRRCRVGESRLHRHPAAARSKSQHPQPELPAAHPPRRVRRTLPVSGPMLYNCWHCNQQGSFVKIKEKLAWAKKVSEHLWLVKTQALWKLQQLHSKKELLEVTSINIRSKGGHFLLLYSR